MTEPHAAERLRHVRHHSPRLFGGLAQTFDRAAPLVALRFARLQLAILGRTVSRMNLRTSSRASSISSGNVKSMAIGFPCCVY
jgi:hypothetical protein